MGMPNAIKALKMQHDAKKMQSKMRERKIKGESKNGMVKIYMNGAREFEDIFIDEDYLDPDMMGKIKEGLKEAFKDYEKKLQRDMAQDIDLDQIKSMFGK